MSAGELRKLTALSAEEVERVCKLFDNLRDLVRFENTKAHLSSTPILPLLADVVGGVKLLCEEDGILLNSIVPDTCQPVFIDRARTLQALSSVLLIAHGVSQKLDTVEVIVTSPTSNTVQLVVRNLNARVESMNAEARLDLALVEANIRSQRANFSCGLEPFSIRIELPSAPIIDSH
jgi:signal transduction histidine kinase